MMIKRKTEITKAVCDACGNTLIDPHIPDNLNRGILKNDFGYGSEPAALDPCGASHVADYDLCGPCFVKACRAVGLKAHDEDKGTE